MASLDSYQGTGFSHAARIRKRQSFASLYNAVLTELLSGGFSKTPMMTHPYFMETSRVGFRQWSGNDLPLARLLWGDAKVTKYLGGPFSEEQLSSRLNLEMQTQKASRIQYWPIFLLENGDLVGCAGLRPYGAHKKVFELGVHLRAEYWRQGLAEEAARAVIEFAFSKFGASALFAGHHPENESSRRLLLKLGFRFTHEELYAPTGEMHPSYLLSAA